jgi:hypothetical protein
MIRLQTGSLGNLLILVANLMAVKWVITRRIPWLQLLLIVALYVVFNPVKNAYRARTWYEANEALGKSEKLSLFIELTVDYWTSGGEQIGNETKRNLVDRISHLSIFAHVLDATPESVPYWEGTSYRMLFYSLIPRIIWPDKPRAEVGQAFGHRYGLIAPTDENTSVNLPWLTEFYANFGTIGVVIGMAVVGSLFRFLSATFGSRRNSELETIVGIALCFHLFWAESDFAMMWGGLVPGALALYVTFQILGNKWHVLTNELLAAKPG